MKSSLSFLALALVCIPPAYAGDKCDPSKIDPEKLFEKLNESTSKQLEKIAKLDGTEEETKAKTEQIRGEIERNIMKYQGELDCLEGSGRLTPVQQKQFDARIDLLREASQGTDTFTDIDRLLDEQLQENDPTNVYPLRVHNKLKYLDTGYEHRNEILETLRTAKKYIHLSYFEMYPDRMGYTMAAIILAKKLGKSTPCGIAEVAEKLGLPAPLNASDCNDVALRVGPIPEENFKAPKKNELIARAQELRKSVSTLEPLPVRIYLDNSKRNKSQLDKAGVLKAFEFFDVEVKVERGVAFLSTHGNNHTKVTANEHRAIIAGGNPVNKVMDWTKIRRWRDAAILIDGELVNDINHFFLAKFKGIRHQDLSSTLCSSLDAACLDEYFPASNMNRAEFTAPGRLIWSSNFDFKFTPTWKTMRDVVHSAQRSLYFENAFFSDGITALLLRAKARKWGLSDAKAANRANGERRFRATCGPEYFNIVSKRPSGRYMLVILPKDMDQFFVKGPERVLTNHLLFEGVDVCKWSGKLDNEVNPQQHGNKFEDKTMLHSKVFMADERVVYLGSANLNRRSMLGDLEIGILTNDPETVREIHEKMFVHDVRASEPVKFNLLNYLFIPLQFILNGLGLT